ncbi:MAG: hypothetical protein Q8919_13250 [Bacteroidota bacterium]|nr:hypothetical protein [Bacteroidota bacterium]
MSRNFSFNVWIRWTISCEVVYEERKSSTVTSDSSGNMIGKSVVVMISCIGR